MNGNILHNLLHHSEKDNSIHSIRPKGHKSYYKKETKQVLLSMKLQLRISRNYSLSDKSDGFPRSSRSGCSADPVNVVLQDQTDPGISSRVKRFQSSDTPATAPKYLRVSGNVIIDDAVNVRNIQSSGRHISCQQHRARLGLELVQSPKTFILHGKARKRQKKINECSMQQKDKEKLSCPLLYDTKTERGQQNGTKAGQHSCACMK